ncbi:Carboxylesterase LipF [Rhodobacteraceae bacterium THAF1]|uniref:alpha/beta fold hydrolase n=1 Tax=Palleronia sp. THAF1 TaxID=2587842 RepID=UPI000F4144F7|nr:alpha/beta fold hydrolase [Palleronia sp. THAF1]QFU10000.1 Carboxylesterase LipF [Palleronia sp. THAF1]VDC17095.1 Carboxylesterase LipF [Rhodobacteraceae bacterium THAF1]
MTDRPKDKAALAQRIRDTEMDGAPDQMRAAFSHLFAPLPDVLTETIAGVPCGMFGEGPPILWLHGGGLVLGSPETHALAAGYVAQATGRQVIVPDYPKAPEHKWPAQPDAAQAVLEALGCVPVVGDSVGGQLALIMWMRRPDLVQRLVLMSPNTDRTGLSETRKRDADLMNDHEGDESFARMALGDYDPTDPEVSPATADLTGLPPTMILACGAEILLDDSLIFARRAALAGAEVDLRVWPGLWHLFPLWPDLIPEGRAALDAAAHYITEVSPSSPARA